MSAAVKTRPRNAAPSLSKQRLRLWIRLLRASRRIEVELRERPGEPIGEVAVATPEVEFLVAHAKCGDLLEVSRGKPIEKRMPQLMPAGRNDPVSLMSEELMRGGPHHVYLHAVNRVRDLL